MKKQFTTILALVFILGLVPINFSNAAGLSDKLSGKILLQVESVGQAWYIDPGTKERAFLGRPADAFRIMRELGLGISERNYNLFNGYAPKNLSGRILLRVEASGEAYYVNPTDLKMYYLGRPADAFKVMREKGLGITDEDLNKVPVFEKYKEQTEANTNAIDLLNKKVSELEEKINTNTSTSTNSCIADTWFCGAWSECSSGGQQIRTCNLTSDCQSVNTPSPSISKSCSYSSNTCTSWTYSDWDACSTNGQQTRTVISSLPSGCIGGNPTTTQSCDLATSVCTTWVYSDWSACQSDGTKTRSVISSSPNGCSGGNPVLSMSCVYNQQTIPDFIVNPVELPEITVNANDTGVIIYQASVKIIDSRVVTFTAFKFENSNENFSYNNIKKLYLYINGLARTIDNLSSITSSSFTFSSLDTSARILYGPGTPNQYATYDITVKADFADSFATSSSFSLYLKDKYSISALNMESNPLYPETDMAINTPSRLMNLVK